MGDRSGLRNPSLWREILFSIFILTAECCSGSSRYYQGAEGVLRAPHTLSGGDMLSLLHARATARAILRGAAGCNCHNRDAGHAAIIAGPARNSPQPVSLIRVANR
jgi:hypothetical protein